MHPVRGEASAASVYGIMQKEARSLAACFPPKLKELTIDRFKNYCPPILVERFQGNLIVPALAQNFNAFYRHLESSGKSFIIFPI